MENINTFRYSDERFADIQMLRYRLNDFDSLTLRQKLLVYYLSEATLWGRDITFDQFGASNLKLRKTLEAIFKHIKGKKEETQEKENSADELAFVEYLKRVWFSSGPHHHYSTLKFLPSFSESYFRNVISEIDESCLPIMENETKEELTDSLVKYVFSPDYLSKRVNKSEGDDVIMTSSCNYYQGVNQNEAEKFYSSTGRNALNSTLVNENGVLTEKVWRKGGLYSPYIEHIVECLIKAADYAENEKQYDVIMSIVRYYESGDLKDFDEYNIKWIDEKDGRIDFVNGFIEVYGDPLGLKGSWEGIVEYTDLEATHRTRVISDNAQWFEDHSPVDARFKKKEVKGVSAKVICAAMLGGDEYPSSAIGINLPNADWIRAEYGSKSVSIGNLVEAYDEAAKGNGFLEEFIDDESVIAIVKEYGDKCDNLHTDLHECLGHGSGQLLSGVKGDDLKMYSSTIEEARADLFALYYMADEKLVELGLLENADAYKSNYYTYIMNGLMTQLVRIDLGNEIEEDHMRNRAIIARWVMEHSQGNVRLEKINGKTYLKINDYKILRMLFAELLSEVQRIKSEGDVEAARILVETYGVKIDPELHKEMRERYVSLNIAPYKGFINPVLSLVHGIDGNITDVNVDYTEGYTEQMMRYSTQYSV